MQPIDGRERVLRRAYTSAEVYRVFLCVHSPANVTARHLAGEESRETSQLRGVYAKKPSLLTSVCDNELAAQMIASNLRIISRRTVKKYVVNLQLFDVKFESNKYG